MKVLAVLLIFCCCKLVVVETTDDHPHYNANGIVCNKCPPGNFIDKDCTKNLANPTCKACPDHQYMDEWNGKKHCKPCKTTCPRNGWEFQACNKTANRVCHCEGGFHRYPLDNIDDHWKCRAHNPCEPGYGEKHYGNHSHDTACEKCVEGLQFVNMADDKHPKCQACSVCVNDTYPLSNCTMTSDTVCSDSATDISTTTTPQPQEDSDGLGGGAIAVIVIGVLVVIPTVIAIVCFLRRHRKKDDKSKRGSNTNGTDNGETRLQLLSTDQNWTEHFIERQVCPFLSRNLGNEWPQFILQLPGWPKDQSVHTIIDHKKEEEGTVPNRILGCLKEWMRMACPQPVNKEGIVAALNFVERKDLIEQLDQMASDPPSSALPNGQL